MRLTPRSFTRAQERFQLWLVRSRTRVQHEGFVPWRNNKPVRRAVLLWMSSIALLVLLSTLQLRSLRAYYLQSTGQPGGSYSEGIIGSITTINPVLSETGANADASRLVFAGLTRSNPNGGIEPDMAESWTVSPDGRSYTFKLRAELLWHDGQPFTSADVAFTVGLIQNPDTRSPMTSAWQGVTVSAPDQRTIQFNLPVRYDAFINSTTVGILPQHILRDVPPADLRVNDFNQAPIGTGPYTLQAFDTDNGSVSFHANKNYFQGPPKIESITLKVYTNQAALQSAFRKRQVMGMARSANSAGTSYGNGATVHPLNIPEEVAAFTRVTSEKLSDVKVRSALSLAVDRDQIVDDVLAGNAEPMVVPALDNQLPAAGGYEIPKANVSEANRLLDEAGWMRSGKSTRTKEGKELRLRLVTAQSEDYKVVGERLRKQLAAVGVAIDIEQYDTATLQRSYIAARNYDILLYGINAGVDLDYYPYWHSSQAKSPGLNVSQYSSAPADKALESARATTDSRVRQVRLKTFLDVWRADNPSIVLYTPHYLYVTQDDVRGIRNGQIAMPADRFYDVHNWTVESKMQPKFEN